MKKTFQLLVILLLAVSLLGLPIPARADVAPPAHPPGSNPGPDSAITQVRLMAETVVMDIVPDTSVNGLGRAKVTADFTMHNLGTAAESMGVRFPISSDNGFGQLPEIKDLNVKVDGRMASTRRIMQEDPVWGGDTVPWAEFNVNFPPNQDVHIQVTYSLDGTGESPFVAFYYVLHTGAGWSGTIGSADLVVRLPYEANTLNVIFDEETGWSNTTSGGVISGNEISWHFDNFEPDGTNDFQLSLIVPSVWKMALMEQANVQNYPNDGEAWGRLGKLYKQMLFFRRSFRHDAGGQQLYQLSIQAYENAVRLKPEDALWHAGFADLLAVHAYYASEDGQDATADIVRSMQEIQHALDLSPKDQKVNEIAQEIYNFFPGAVVQYESGYDFLWLTATPVFTTPTVIAVKGTATSEPVTASPTETTVPTAQPTPASMPAPTAKNPICGSALFIPLILVGYAWKRKRHSSIGND